MKRLIICLDGTWMAADRGPHATNVVNLMRAIAPRDDDDHRQLIHYASGVGASGTLTSKIWEGATGAGLEENVKDAYLFLGNNYEEGDEVFLFGFSRGAFTARSLAGFIAAAGLLDRFSMGRLQRAWKYYRAKPEGRKHLQHPGGREIEIECIGVWDTVGSRGIPLRWFSPARWISRKRYGFHDVRLSPSIRCALQAVAVDEKRGPFPPTLWQRQTDKEPPQGQVVEQVWFAGCHADVGGGVEPRDVQAETAQAHTGLPDLALEWMVDRVTRLTALKLRDDWYNQRRTIRGDPLGHLHESRRLPKGLPYLSSWVLPFQRVIYAQDGWTRRLLPSRNRPAKGHGFINEALHASVLHRQGKTPKGARRAYDPKNVRAAQQGGVPVVAWEPREKEAGGPKEIESGLVAE